MTLTDQDCDYVRTLVRNQSGIVLERDKTYLVESRLLGLARREGLSTLESLVTRLRSAPPLELQKKVVEALTTNETSFYRDAQPFEALKQIVLPDLMTRRAATKQLVVWCGASSTGQEPYSLAMLMDDHFPALADWTVRIIASDLSVDVLDRARKGVYSQIEINRGLPARLLVKYFDRKGLDWQIKDSIRKRVEYRQVNLIEQWPILPNPDIVLMRNVLIYFDVGVKKTILGKIRKLLRPDGYLFLGGAETTLNLDENFVRVPFERSGCYRLRTAAEGKTP